MFKISKQYMGAVFGLITTIALANPASAGVLKVEVDGIEEMTGKIMIAVYDKAEYFPSKSDKAIKKISAKVTAETMLVTVGDLPPGKYGLSIYHDENSNEEFDKNFMGIPKELYGFSNNIRGFGGPPKFEATLITVSEEQTTISVSME
ncbi:MAG: DUF2141 domain-containing protein [Alphaproteobacteria bacterium]|nr:DUF2141 domain-containing protein [Rhodospirillales bacterium]MCW9046001.1 DUF2141 domain-containing protein [Alphaproteobacteria bacterium]